MSRAILVPVAKQLQGQAKQILRGAGLSILKPKFFLIDSAKAAIEDEAYTQSIGDGYDKVGLFGTPVWDTVTLTMPTYTDDNGNTVQSVSLQLDIALIEINNIRNIVKTSVSGRNGTIKEYMSDGDETVKIRGILSSQYESKPPYELLDLFKKIKTAPVSMEVESNFLGFMGIFNLVIENPILRQKEGARNAWDFELDCVSDTPFELNA